MTELERLYQQIAGCPDCDLCHSRRQAVPGEGPADARIMFVGEAPGWYEDQQGRPFVGPAGQLLDQLLALAGLRRQAVYICNVIKCRPPNNRDPLPKEIEACRKWLARQLELIKPQAIVTLGRHSLAWFSPREAIGKVHGTARLREDGTVLVHMYHPAAALHQQSLRRSIEEDFRKLPALIAATQRSRSQSQQTEAQQMRLF